MAGIVLEDDASFPAKKKKALSTPAQPATPINNQASYIPNLPQPPRPPMGQNPFRLNDGTPGDEQGGTVNFDPGPPPAPSPPPAPAPLANPFNSQYVAPTDAGQSSMIDRDRGSWEQRLRDEAQRAGVGYDPSDLQGVVNFTSYASNAGRDPMEAINRMIQNYQQRASNSPNTGVPGTSSFNPSPASSQPSAPAAPRPVAVQPQYQYGAERDTYLKDLYQKFLDRLPSEEEQRAQLEAARGVPDWGNEVIRSFLDSQEYQARVPVETERLYQQHLGRSVSPDELRNHYRNPYGIPGIEFAVLDSDEYKNRPQPPAPSVVTPLVQPPPGPTAPPPAPSPQPSPTSTVSLSNGPSSSFSQSQNVPAQFSDPITSYLEQIAQDRARRLEQPPEDSGQYLLEQALRALATQFEKGGYTPAEQEIFQTQAIEPLEQLRASRRQQVMESLSRRGIDPNSGIAIQMLQDVDRQFDALRTQTQRDLAGQIANERTQRMLMSLQQLSNLAGTENQRMDQAFQYRTVPLNLADRAFGQGLQISDRAFGRADTAFNQRLALTDRAFGQANTVADRGFGQAMNLFNSAGNPNSLISSLTSLLNQQENSRQFNTVRQDQRDDNWQEGLGYLIRIWQGMNQ